jgi:hypothetical protein
MKLLDLQKKFTLLVAELIGHAYSQGYALTFGEAWRSPETCMLYARKGTGVIASLHRDRLAIDLNLFKGDKYCTDVESYRELGEYWEKLGTPDLKTCWGGRFRSGDGNHFSIEYQGRR